ncbi:ITA2B protein, partial [Alcedo cyanopectus]|nr:ITA2B protein [Ceyx cyanopectus]
LDAELQLDRLKPRLSGRVLLLQGHQPSWHQTLSLAPGTAPLCHNLTAYLRDEAEFKDKLSPVALSLRLALPGRAPGLVLYGDTLVQAQVGRGTGLSWGHCHCAQVGTCGYPQPRRPQLVPSVPNPSLGYCPCHPPVP